MIILIEIIFTIFFFVMLLGIISSVYKIRFLFFKAKALLQCFMFLDFHLTLGLKIPIYLSRDMVSDELPFICLEEQKMLLRGVGPVVLKFVLIVSTSIHHGFLTPPGKLS